MKRLTLFLATLLSLAFLAGCSEEFQAGVIAGAAHHIELEVEFQCYPPEDIFVEDFCEHFNIDVPWDPNYSDFQAGAWIYLFFLLNQ